MSTATLTSKGQVTIPKPVRDALQLHAGDRINFVVRDDGVVEIRPATVDLKRLKGLLRRRGQALTIEEMDTRVARTVRAEAGRR
jgi:antitoxin PrlF